jgi:predicted CoA-substrate-specific enzyme activase
MHFGPRDEATMSMQSTGEGSTPRRFLGIDLGAEAVKIVELCANGTGLELGRRLLIEHRKDPVSAVLNGLANFDWPWLSGAAATGRLSPVLNLRKIPTRAAQSAALAFLLTDSAPLMLVSIGSRGFSVLEVCRGGRTVFRENTRCSQGTGNFLAQLAKRFGLTVEQASLLTADVQNPASLSARCPVILKTDMTHLANRGEPRERILAGLFDAVCENVQSLIKPRTAPRRVLLGGGVCRSSRVRRHFQSFFEKHGMGLIDWPRDEGIFLEAIGAALEAARLDLPAPDLAALRAAPAPAAFEEAPALRHALHRVNRMTRPAAVLGNIARRLVLGLDIGSTGSKLVALDADSRHLAWEGYRNTGGDPLGAAKGLVAGFDQDGGKNHEVLAFGATGSGREIVGSLLASCYGAERVFVLNEIAAHATGALHYDSRVDTIFEIGGQDAKYIRLSSGQVCDAAMNEACSAGTGSFIEEQGSKLTGISSVTQMSELALRAESCVSLGQHCSVFMAEIIDAAVASGRTLPEVIAGVYDSVIQNYLNRVKGNRSIGQRIFCQGMPFSSDALAAALASRTCCDVTIPPSPGTVGALGIALLAARELAVETLDALDLQRFLAATVVKKDVFVCQAKSGCGGAGNKCRIERLTTLVGQKELRFRWGGTCSLYDRGMGRKKLPPGTPDPFRERQELIQAVIERSCRRRPGRPRVATTDEFVLKNLFPFFATFLYELGMDLEVRTGAGRKTLKRGIEEFRVPYCAPLQLYCGLISELLETSPDYVLLPMLRDVPKIAGEPLSKTCSLAQASSDLVRLNLHHRPEVQVVTPVLDAGPGLNSRIFRDHCRRLASALGAGARNWKPAFEKALAAQLEFQSQLHVIGRRALDHAAQGNLTPVVVLGRTYTIYNNVLNSNVPNLLRELGALPIPVDCYPTGGDVPVFRDVYWNYSQMNLRAAHQIRRTAGVYSVFCSNYSCGPDSFNLHFYSHLMEHKPFAIIETDGHSGDAGTKTRLEAFLYCVDMDKRAQRNSSARPFNALHDLEEERLALADVKRSGRLLLIPRMGPGAEIVAAILRAEGMRAEALPVPDRAAINLGRRCTSGKECLPFIVTLGSVLKRVQEGQPGEKYALFMAKGNGPCRFGTYNFCDKVILRRLGLEDRVCVVSQSEEDYFRGFSHGFELKVWAALVTGDFLQDMLHDVRPVERVPGSAAKIYQECFANLIGILEHSPAPLFVQGVSGIPGDVFGLRGLLHRASLDLAAAVDCHKSAPTVGMTGEIYVRCDPGSNDSLIERLEERGLRIRLAPAHEWIEYADWCNWQDWLHKRRKLDNGLLSATISTALRWAVMTRLYNAARKPLGWPKRISAARAVRKASPYLSPKHQGEAVLTIGAPICMHERGEIAGVVCAAPLECLPSKIAESQLIHVSEDTGLPALSVYFNGDPLDTAALDNFVYEVQTRCAHQNVGSLRAQSKSSEGWRPWPAAPDSQPGESAAAAG